jgi:predicted DsbA family dithiol-disulfide isomerase
MHEMLAKKYGMSLEQAKANTQNMVQMAKEAGLDYRLDTLILTNTFDAHRLTLFAKAEGLMEEMTERILRAYFTESKHIGDHETLAELAAEVGLDKGAVERMLAGDEMAEAVREDQRTAAKYGITAVPFYLIDKKYALTGAQPTELFIQALERVIAEEKAAD